MCNHTKCNENAGTSRRAFLKASSMLGGVAVVGGLPLGRSAYAGGGDTLKVEQDVFFAAIREGKPINHSEYMCQSTLMGILGREASYTGLDGVGSNSVKVFYDVSNSLRRGYDIYKEIPRLGDRICQFHMKENRLLGQGMVDFPRVRDAICAIGYLGQFAYVYALERSRGRVLLDTCMVFHRLGVSQLGVVDLATFGEVHVPGKRRSAAGSDSLVRDGRILLVLPATHASVGRRRGIRSLPCCRNPMC